MFKGFSITVLICVIGIIAGAFSGCTGAESRSEGGRSQDYLAPVAVGRIETNEVRESSGLAISACQPNVLWTHNDAGSDAFIFALSESGKHLGTWRVAGAQNVDWEDMDSFSGPDGKCFLYIGDIGDNEKERGELTIYRIPEPIIKPEDAVGTTAKPIMTGAAEVMRFRYADTGNNSETLLVHPKTGVMYIVTKEKKRPASIYKVQPGFGSPAAVMAEKLGEIAVPAEPKGLLTGGSISPDGSRAVLCDVQNGYELLLPPGSSNFDDIWRQRPLVVDLGDRKQGEGVTYSADGKAIYASSEKKNATLYLIKRR